MRKEKLRKILFAVFTLISLSCCFYLYQVSHIESHALVTTSLYEVESAQEMILSDMKIIHTLVQLFTM